MWGYTSLVSLSLNLWPKLGLLYRITWIVNILDVKLNVTVFNRKEGSEWKKHSNITNEGTTFQGQISQSWTTSEDSDTTLPSLVSIILMTTLFLLWVMLPSLRPLPPLNPPRPLPELNPPELYPPELYPPPLPYLLE